MIACFVGDENDFKVAQEYYELLLSCQDMQVSPYTLKTIQHWKCKWELKCQELRNAIKKIIKYK